MKYLLKNIFRTILKNKGSYLGGICVIALGIVIYISMSNMATTLQKTVNTYYKEYNFADIFAQVKAIPENKLKMLENIEGIKISDAKLSVEARLILDNSDNIVSLHIMSYDKENTILNKFMVPKDFNYLNNKEILLGNKMLEAYKFNLNENLNVIIDGKLESFNIAGGIQAPNYIITIPPSGGMSDSKIFDIACINKDELQKILNKKNIVNELSFMLEDGYEFSDVKYKLEQELNKYGLISLVESKYQSSNYSVQAQIQTFVGLATMLPAIFLTVSVFMLYIILKKMIDQDRTLIGTIKAFGFKDSEIISTYMKQGIITGILGAIFGSILAIPFSMYLLNMIVSVFNIPSTGFSFHISNVLIGILLSLITSILATYFGIKEVININPAEAMRSLSPKFNNSFDFPKIMTKLFNSKQMMGIRAVFRNKFRSLVISFSIAIPFSFIVVINAFLSTQQELMLSQFTKVQTYDLKINLSNYVNYNDAINSVANLDNIYNVEAIAEYGVNLKHNSISKQSSLTALNSNSPIYKIMDMENRYYEPPKNGLIMNSNIAKKLNIKEGDTVEIENTSLSSKNVKLKVIKIINESSGSGCYINIESMNKYFDVDNIVNSIVFNIPPQNLENTKAFFMNSKNISSIIDKEIALKGFRSNMESNTSLMNVFALLSVIAGVVLIYNISNISIRERKNEFGTMNILGLTFNEIGQTIIFEQIINLTMGLFIGFPAIFALKKAIETMASADTVFEIKIQISSYISSFIICLFIILFSLIAIMKNIKKIELTDVLKERE